MIIDAIHREVSMDINDMTVKERVCSFENLFKAMHICKRDVLWKDSTAGFVKNGLVNCMKLHDALMNDKYEIDKYTIFYVHEPKERRIVSTRIKDRTFQRSLCDNYLTDEVSRHFIYDNCACQKGKGTMFARNRLVCHLQRFRRKHNNGYVLKCDISDFFGSTRHDVAVSAMRKRVRDEWAMQEVERIINSFNDGDDPNVGIGLGSQVSQLIELAVLDDIDHFIKEELRIRQYVRYMDDFILIHESKTYLCECRDRINEELNKIGLSLSEKKTQIFPLTQPIKFLGFSYTLSDTGKVIMRLLPDKKNHEKRKLRRLVQRCKDGFMSRDDVDKCFEAWKAHASQGDSYYLIERMARYYEDLWSMNEDTKR